MNIPFINNIPSSRNLRRRIEFCLADFSVQLYYVILKNPEHPHSEFGSFFEHGPEIDAFEE